MKKNRVLAMTLAVATAGSLAACGSTNTAGVQSTAACRSIFGIGRCGSGGFFRGIGCGTGYFR